MKTYIFSIVILAGVIIFASCEDELDIKQHGVSTFDTFYKTDAEAEEAIVACYSNWKDTYQSAFWIKNLLSDECYAGGESWQAANGHQLSNYTFDSEQSYIRTLYTNLYKVIYAANIALTYVEEDSPAKLRVRAEAKVFRAMAYIELISLWGTPPLVDHPLAANEYSQANGDPAALWALVETDLTEAINSGSLTEKSNPNDQTYRITKQYAQALLGKAHVYQKEWTEAAAALDAVINSGKYVLYDDFENILTTKAENNSESMFESNYIFDMNNIWGMGDMIWVYANWRGDMLTFDLNQTTYSSNGWGFFNPTKEAYSAFKDIGDTYRLNASIKTTEQMAEIGITIRTSIAYMYDQDGLFGWKYRIYNSDNVFLYFDHCPNNPRYMRYAEVLLLAAEAHVNGGGSKAAEYINQVRTRAQLPPLANVSMDDIKKERRAELFMEGCRYHDLVRWGDASTVLATRGQFRPALYPDGHVEQVKFYDPGDCGFKTGKHELLPFPAAEMQVNSNMTQNPGW